MDFTLVSDDPYYESFMHLDRNLELVILAPSVSVEADTYDKAYLRFFFVDEPDLGFNVRIESKVDSCTYETVNFESGSI